MKFLFVAMLLLVALFGVSNAMPHSPLKSLTGSASGFMPVAKEARPTKEDGEEGGKAKGDKAKKEGKAKGKGNKGGKGPKGGKSDKEETAEE